MGWSRVLLLLVITGCGGSPTVANCPTLSCKVACDARGTRKDDHTGCATCLCAGAPGDTSACPAISCAGSCGLGAAADPATGCATCDCCFPADCQPGGCHGTGADGCPTCGPC